MATPEESSETSKAGVGKLAQRDLLHFGILFESITAAGAVGGAYPNIDCGSLHGLFLLGLLPACESDALACSPPAPPAKYQHADGAIDSLRQPSRH